MSKCSHDWRGVGGCDENPGVWSRGGTTYTYESMCRRCRATREAIRHGSQRNPGEVDSYRIIPDDGEPGPWRCLAHDEVDCDSGDFECGGA